jgi:hypothetical protein
MHRSAIASLDNRFAWNGLLILPEPNTDTLQTLLLAIA